MSFGSANLQVVPDDDPTTDTFRRVVAERLERAGVGSTLADLGKRVSDDIASEFAPKIVRPQPPKSPSPVLQLQTEEEREEQNRKLIQIAEANGQERREKREREVSQVAQLSAIRDELADSKAYNFRMFWIAVAGVAVGGAGSAAAIITLVVH